MINKFFLDFFNAIRYIRDPDSIRVKIDLTSLLPHEGYQDCCFWNRAIFSNFSDLKIFLANELLTLYIPALRMEG